jgi:diguanylate cyclase (GGDEF)-like protein
MPSLKQRVSGANSAVVLLVVAAVMTLVLTVVAGAFVYGNTRRLIAADEWVQHSDDVLAALQRASLLTERIEYRTRIYRLTSDEDQLIRARNSSNLLQTTVGRLSTLIADNPNQNQNIHNLASSAADLNQSVFKFTNTSPLPEVQVQRCQQIISQMTDQEQWLLKERTTGTQRSSFTSIGTEIICIGLSLVTLLVLFGLLLRDALVRVRIGKEAASANERLARTVNALEEQAVESDLLTSARDELQLCITVQQVYESAAMSLSRLLIGTSGSLCIINNSRQLVEVVSSWEGAGGKSSIDDFHLPESCCGLRSGNARWRQPGVSEIHCSHFAGEPPERYLCKPIVAHGNTLGVLYIQCEDEHILENVNHRMVGLRQLIQLTGMAVATLNLRIRLENQSIRDSLTGLFNRHFMQISLDREVSRAARRNQSLAVLMLDVDHFKNFNDTFGHAAGDTVLKAVADLFRASIRSEDVACRYGGEEFAIIIPDVTQAGAFDRAEAIRQGVANLRVPLEQETFSELTVSIGIAIYPNDGEASDLLLRRADLALYRAKRQGRNQVAVYESAVPVTQ